MLGKNRIRKNKRNAVSVAGCLGYDVLGAETMAEFSSALFQLLVV